MMYFIRNHVFLLVGVTLGLSILFLSPAIAGKSHPPVQMATADPTGSWFPTGAAVADLANKLYDNQPISVIPGAGAIGNIMRVGNNKSDMGLSYGPFLKLAMQGGNDINPGKGFNNLRAIMSFTAYPMHILVTEDLGLSSLADVREAKDKLRLATGQTGSSNFFIFSIAMSKYGAPLKSVEKAGGRVTQTNWAGMTDAWKNRQINMMSAMFTPPHPSIIELMSIQDSEIIGFTDEVLAELSSELGFLSYDITPEHYPEQSKAIKTIGSPTVLFGSADIGEELVYDMTKQAAENRDRLLKSVAAFKFWKPEDMHKGLSIEIHPGALRYYKERGWIK